MDPDISDDEDDPMSASCWAVNLPATDTTAQAEVTRSSPWHLPSSGCNVGKALEFATPHVATPPSYSEGAPHPAEGLASEGHAAQGDKRGDDVRMETAAEASAVNVAVNSGDGAASREKEGTATETTQVAGGRTKRLKLSAARAVQLPKEPCGSCVRGGRPGSDGMSAQSSHCVAADGGGTLADAMHLSGDLESSPPYATATAQDASASAASRAAAAPTKSNPVSSVAIADPCVNSSRAAPDADAAQGAAVVIAVAYSAGTSTPTAGIPAAIVLTEGSKAVPAGSTPAPSAHSVSDAFTLLMGKGKTAQRPQPNRKPSAKAESAASAAACACEEISNAAAATPDAAAPAAVEAATVQESGRPAASSGTSQADKMEVEAADEVFLPGLVKPSGHEETSIAEGEAGAAGGAAPEGSGRGRPQRAAAVRARQEALSQVSAQRELDEQLSQKRTTRTNSQGGAAAKRSDSALQRGPQCEANDGAGEANSSCSKIGRTRPGASRADGSFFMTPTERKELRAKEAELAAAASAAEAAAREAEREEEAQRRQVEAKERWLKEQSRVREELMKVNSGRSVAPIFCGGGSNAPAVTSTAVGHMGCDGRTLDVDDDLLDAAVSIGSSAVGNSLPSWYEDWPWDLSCACAGDAGTVVKAPLSKGTAPVCTFAGKRARLAVGTPQGLLLLEPPPLLALSEPSQTLSTDDGGSLLHSRSIGTERKAGNGVGHHGGSFDWLGERATRLLESNELDGTLWCDALRPRACHELCGNQSAAMQLRSWLQRWVEAQAEKSDARRRKRKAVRRGTQQARRSRAAAMFSSDDSDFIVSDEESDNGPVDGNLLVLEGPHGAGKSAAIRACALELGFQVIEINAGEKDGRSGKTVFSRFAEATQSHELGKWACSSSSTRATASDLPAASLGKRSAPSACRDTKTSASGATKKTMNPFVTLGTGSKRAAAPSAAAQRGVKASTKAGPTRSSCPAVEDVSVADAAVEMSLVLFEEIDIVFEDDKGFYNALHQLADSAKCPVVATCNLLPDELQPSLPPLRWSRPTVAQLVAHTSVICSSLHINISERELRNLAQYYESDVRQLLLNLQCWGSTSRSNGCTSANRDLTLETTQECDTVTLERVLGFGNLAPRSPLADVLLPWASPLHAQQRTETASHEPEGAPSGLQRLHWQARAIFETAVHFDRCPILEHLLESLDVALHGELLGGSAREGLASNATAEARPNGETHECRIELGGVLEATQGVEWAQALVQEAQAAAEPLEAVGGRPKAQRKPGKRGRRRIDDDEDESTEGTAIAAGAEIREPNLQSDANADSTPDSAGAHIAAEAAAPSATETASDPNAGASPNRPCAVAPEDGACPGEPATDSAHRSLCGRSLDATGESASDESLHARDSRADGPVITAAGEHAAWSSDATNTLHLASSVEEKVESSRHSVASTDHGEESEAAPSAGEAKAEAVSPLSATTGADDSGLDCSTAAVVSLTCTASSVVPSGSTDLFPSGDVALATVVSLKASPSTAAAAGSHIHADTTCSIRRPSTPEGDKPAAEAASAGFAHDAGLLSTESCSLVTAVQDANTAPGKEYGNIGESPASAEPENQASAAFLSDQSAQTEVIRTLDILSIVYDDLSSAVDLHNSARYERFQFASRDEPAAASAIAADTQELMSAVSQALATRNALRLLRCEERDPSGPETPRHHVFSPMLLPDDAGEAERRAQETACKRKDMQACIVEAIHTTGAGPPIGRFAHLDYIGSVRRICALEEARKRNSHRRLFSHYLQRFGLGEEDVRAFLN